MSKLHRLGGLAELIHYYFCLIQLEVSVHLAAAASDQAQ